MMTNPELNILIRQLREHCLKRGLRYKTRFWSVLFHLTNLDAMGERARRNTLFASQQRVNKIKHDLARHEKFKTIGQFKLLRYQQAAVEFALAQRHRPAEFRQTLRQALEADGEKLRALTGMDHGPWDVEELADRR